jgi:hypothetical protein
MGRYTTDLPASYMEQIYTTKHKGELIMRKKTCDKCKSRIDKEGIKEFFVDYKEALENDLRNTKSDGTMETEIEKKIIADLLRLVKKDEKEYLERKDHD